MNVIATRAAEGFPRRSFTVAEIRRMIDAGIIPGDENFELIEGELVPMSPKGNQHEVIKAALNDVFSNRPREFRLAVETSVYLDERTFVEPDLCLYPKRILPEDVKGTDVILAIEISGSSLGYDRGLKARVLARHGVQELWVVEAETRVTWVHRSPQPDGNWGSIERVASDTALSPAALPQISVRMGDLD
ncbi:MAG: Uma2 family endonuclease [Mesorhizobium sp.]|nr:Uma2 family endonuclease [Mesorhizobium sp.]MCO5160257.1 Uma2 family endonuclease [Mesorhizobium sp.]